MNFKSISTILTILSFELLALSSPVNNNNDKEILSDGDDMSKMRIENSKNIKNEKFLINEAEITDIAEEVEIENDIEETTEIDSADEDENVCNTKECVEVSNNLLNSIDPSIDPCEDFYQFTCGNYIKNHNVDAFNYYFSNFSSENNEEIIKIIEGEYQPNKNLSKQDQEYDEIVFNKLKGFYKSCMDSEDYDIENAKSIIDIINKLKIHENKDLFNDPNELAKMLAKLHHMKISPINSFIADYLSPLFNLEIKIDDKMNIYILLSKATLYIKESNKEEIKDELQKIYRNSENKNIDKMIDSFIEFEKKLFKINNEGQNDIISGETITFSVKSLNEKYSNINWKLYLEEQFKFIDKEDIITDDTQINISNVEYFENLNKVLSEVDGETLSYYFELNLILNYGILFPITFKHYLGYKDGKANNCYNIVNSFMDSAIAKYYVEKNFSEDKKKYSEKVIEYIKQSMMNRIPNIKWLDDETIEYAYKKVGAMKETIGYQDFILNSKTIYEKYKTFEVDENDFIFNIINGYKFYNDLILKVVTNIKGDNLELSPQSTNAQYVITKNQINIPAGILQPPFFSSGIPDYINYGGIGSIIGHELTHAFDNDGKNYDMNGDLFNWWTSNDFEEYEDLTKCFINQYNQFYIEDLKGKKHNVNGELTLNENIADNGGMARAYESWKYSLMEDPETVKKENPQLPGLTQYTPEQLFFISFGHIWCENIYKHENYLDFLLMNVHSPGIARVNGVVSNSKEFAKAFNCPLKSKMNPENKCEIW